MKFISKILNLLMLCATFCLMTCAEWGIYNVIALPAGSESRIAIVSADRDGDGVDDNVAYFDTFSFWGDDIKESVTREPRYLVRSWFSADWWQNGMKWADYAIEVVVGITVPIFAPIYEVSQIQYYYSDLDIYTDIGNWRVYGIQQVNDEVMAYPEEHQELLKGYVNCFLYSEGISSADPDSTVGGYIKRVNREVTENGTVYVLEDIARWSKDETYEIGSSEWCKNNAGFINTLLKINKYNYTDDNGYCVYDRWVAKFMTKNSLGDYVIKPTISVLYFQFYLAVFLAIWFVCQNPIKIKRDENGDGELSGGFKKLGRAKRDRNKKYKK